MTYADGRRILDADSHVMELPGWLEDHADPDDRHLIRPLKLGAAGAFADAEVAKAEARRADATAAAALENHLMTAKGWAALGAFDPTERSRALDLLGFDRQLVFSTFAPLQFLDGDVEALYAGARAHNRAMGAWCADDPRLVGVGFVPLVDPERSIAAVDDCLAFGCGALHLPSAPPRDKAPTHPDFDGMWARIAEAGLPVLLHLGGQGPMIRRTFHNNGRPVTDLFGGGENLRSKDAMAMHMAPEVFVSTLIFDGLFDTHPDLMVGVIEQGAEWVVPWLPRLDRMHKAFAKTEPALQSLQLAASEYVHRNVRVTPFVGERVGWMIEQAGDDLFLFSSDYPHPEGHRDPIAKFEATMDGVGDEARRKFYGDNMAGLLPRADAGLSGIVDMEAHFATVWESFAAEIPDAVAVVQGPVRRTWAELDDRAGRLASAFTAAGLGPGSSVAQYLYNAPEYIETLYAALKIRAVPVNVNYRYLDDELLYLLENSEAEALVCHASLLDRVEHVRGRAPRLRLVLVVDDDESVETRAGEDYEQVLAAHTPVPPVPRDPGDILMLYTGGTTGIPKGVMIRLGPLVTTYLSAVPPLAGAAPVTSPEGAAALARQLADEDRSLVSLPACPLMHGTGLAIGTLPALTVGGRVVLLPHGDVSASRRSGGFDPDELWETVERERVNGITIVGDAFARPLLRSLETSPDRDLSSLVTISSSGAMLAAEVKEGLLERIPHAMILDYIAASEGTMGLAIAVHGTPVVTGRFTPAPGVKVLNPEGHEVVPGSGESGRVAVTASVPVGYFHDEAKSGETFPEIDGVRYSFPGDWATVEADGSIMLLGRGSQCINTGGEKVYPEEVETVLKTHPAVEDCLVFGVPDERFGQRIVAVASLAPGVTPPDRDEILAVARQRLASYKVPRALELIETVPRAPNGKADYPAARALFDDAGQAVDTSPR